MRERESLFLRIVLVVLVVTALSAWWHESQRQLAEGSARLAIRYMRQGNLEAAEGAIKAALRYSRDAAYFGVYALVEAKRGMAEFPFAAQPNRTAQQQALLRQAFEAYSKAIVENPNDDLFWHNRGWVRLSLGENPRLALDDFERAIQINGADPSYRISAAVTYDGLGEAGRGLEQYVYAAMAEPTILESGFFQDMQEREPDRWGAIVKRAISQLQMLQSHKPDAVVQARLGALYMAQGDRVRAASELEAVTRTFPELAGAWSNLGRLYMASKHQDKARDCFKKELLLGRRSGQALFDLSLASQNARNGQRAEALLARASRAFARQASSHATRVKRMYGTTAVVGDDVLPVGLLNCIRIPGALLAYRESQFQRSNDLVDEMR